MAQASFEEGPPLSDPDLNVDLLKEIMEPDDIVIQCPAGLSPPLLSAFLEIGCQGASSNGADILQKMKQVLTCPLCNEVLVDPVLCKTNMMTFERSSILAHIALGPSGVTGETLPAPLGGGLVRREDLTPNTTVKRLLQLIKLMERKINGSEDVDDKATTVDEGGADASTVGNFVPSLVCPIGQHAMKSPWMTKTGRSYEGAHIKKWVNMHGTSPASRQKLSVSDLRPNLALKSSALEWEQQTCASVEEKRKLLAQLFELGTKLREQEAQDVPQTPTRKKRRLTEAFTI